MDNKLSTMQDKVTNELSGMGSFLGRVWNVYKQRIVTLLLIMVADTLLIALTAGIFTALVAITGSALTLIGIPIAVWITIWGMTAFYMAIIDQDCSVKEAFHLAKPKTLSHLWVGILTSVIICGGYLLLIVPGLIFTVLFIFTPFVLLCEDDRGMNALIKSKEYVRGRWLTVGLRLFVLCIIFPALSGIVPLLGQFLVLPFTFIGIYLTYEELKDTKAKIAFYPSRKAKVGVLATSTLGFLFIPLVLFTMMGSMSLPMLKGLLAGMQFPVKSDQGLPLTMNEVSPEKFSTGKMQVKAKPLENEQMEETPPILSNKSREPANLTLHRTPPENKENKNITELVDKTIENKEKVSPTEDKKTTINAIIAKETKGNTVTPAKVVDKKPTIKLAHVVEKPLKSPDVQSEKVIKKPGKERTSQVSALQKKKQLRKPLIDVPPGSDKVKLYISLLKNETIPWYIRNDAARELGLAEDKRAIKPLIDALQSDAHPYTRREAALALSKLNEKIALEPLTRVALDDHNEWVSQYAVDAIDGLISKKLIIRIHTSK